ncbi:MAG TPA: 50S ribosomal protein L11 methyltransferase [Vicinamibacterales bacterium]
MNTYPALDLLTDDPDLLYPRLDDFGPTAIEDLCGGIRVFFPTPEARDNARTALIQICSASAIDVPDEDWARRSQEHLEPVTVGRVTIRPRQTEDRASSNGISIVIEPSMGFGTGHHATTRLCLAAMQTFDLAGKSVLDVGTGSGVLAIAGVLLGARAATGVDVDPDAIQSAITSLSLNPSAAAVMFVTADYRTTPLPPADVVTANLTGALLARSAKEISRLVAPNGALVLSGVMTSERDEVVRAFDSLPLVWERNEDEWVGLVMKKS